MLYLCISVGNIEKESRRKAVSCNEELYPREREDKQVHTLLTQRVTFVFRVIYVKSHSSCFGPQRVLIMFLHSQPDECLRTHQICTFPVFHPQDYLYQL